MLCGSLKDKLLHTSRRCFLNNFLLFLLVFFDGAKDSTARGLPTEGRRRLYQTTADPIPHPNAVSLKKSETINLLRNKFRFYNVLVNWPTKSATPQRPFEESAVKKSNTEGRPLEQKQNLNFFLDSRPNADHEKANNSSEEDFIVSGALQDEDQLSFGQENMRSKINKAPTYKYEEGFLRRKKTPIMPSDNSDGELLAAKARVFKMGKATRKALSLPLSEYTFSRDSLESKTEVYRREQTSRDSIPHLPPENNVGESLGNKRALIFSDDTAKILERKTLLYSEPFYRPTGALEKNEHLDPRRLISILGDPLPVYKRSDFADQNAVTMVRADTKSRREQHSKGRVRRAHHRKAHFRPHRQQFLDSKKENWDQDEEDIGQTMDFSGLKRSPNEYSMLERLINDNTISFGTKAEQLDKESTIKEVEALSAQSTRPYSDEHLMGLPDDLSTMEVSEGELPPYDKLPGQHVGLDIRRNHISKKMEQKSRASLNAISSQVGDDREKTGNEADSSARPRLRRKKKRSLRHHFHHHHHWRSPYFHVRSQEFSPYYDYQEEHEPIEFIPRITRFMDFPRFPVPRRLPKFPMSLMSERFVPYPRLPKIAEYSPPQLETLEHYPEPPPIPTAISEREKAGSREQEPVDEWAPLPEPVPAPEPPPIPEPAPIPELAPIKEIPPIKEPQEKTPPNLDPKKTFDTGESNGGVKKSS